MKVIAITSPGEPSVLRTEERPRPEATGDELLVRVAGAGVNRADVLQRRGLYPPPPGIDPVVPGLEYSGTVAAAGPRAQYFTPGDRVMGLIPGAAYAEYLCVPESTAMPVPANLDLIEAAALPEAFLTAYRALFLEGRLAAGQRVLIRAASSGVGLAAVQLAAFAGARVLAGSRQPERLPTLEDLGAAIAFEDRHDAARLAAGQPGADLALEFLGGRFLEQNLRSLRAGGRLVLVGLITGREARLDLGLLLTRRLHLDAFTMRSLTVWQRAEITHQFADRFLPAFMTNKLRPIVGQTYPFSAAPRAHADMEAGRVFGKLILTPGDDT